jgi:hypothetical protein
MNQASKLPLFFAPILLMLSTYCYFIQINTYGFHHQEAVLLGILCLFMGIFFGILLLYVTWIFQLALLTLLILMHLSFFPFFYETWHLILTLIIIFFIGFFTLESFPVLICVMSTVFIFSLFLLPLKRPLITPVSVTHSVKINPRLPTMIHIIFDEHIGLNAIPTSIDGDESLKHDLLSFYRKNGFTIYPNAYSHEVRTVDSIPELLNFSAKAESEAYVKPKGDNFYLTQNKAFDLLSAKGYALNIIQPDYINFCEKKGIRLESCYTYPIHPVKAVASLPLSSKEHLIYILKSYLLSSSISSYFMRFYSTMIQPIFAYFSIETPYVNWYTDQITVLAVPSALDTLTQDVIAHPNGRVYFVHLLLPHYTYIFNAQCQPNEHVNTWLTNFDSIGNTNERRALRYHLYEGQLRCGYQLLGRFFDKLRQAGIYDQLSFIIQGDHSSRIAMIGPFDDYRDKLSWEEFDDNYATLFVEKLGKTPSHIDNQRTPINVLYAKALEKILQKPILTTEDEAYVYLATHHPEAQEPRVYFKLSEFK